MTTKGEIAAMIATLLAAAAGGILIGDLVASWF